jgi:hypothetical protein
MNWTERINEPSFIADAELPTWEYMRDRLTAERQRIRRRKYVQIGTVLAAACVIAFLFFTSGIRTGRSIGPGAVSSFAIIRIPHQATPAMKNNDSINSFETLPKLPPGKNERLLSNTNIAIRDTQHIVPFVQTILPDSATAKTDGSPQATPAKAFPRMDKNELLEKYYQSLDADKYAESNRWAPYKPSYNTKMTDASKQASTIKKDHSLFSPLQ